MRKTVLIVDDDEDIRQMTRLVLCREGYDVLMAPDGLAAIGLMASSDHASSVCALLCDLEMPDMGGRELIEYFGIHFPIIPIIILSGASDTVFLDGIVQRGVGDWVRKPVTREILVDKVRTATQLCALRRQQQLYQQEPMSNAPPHEV